MNHGADSLKWELKEELSAMNLRSLLLCILVVCEGVLSGEKVIDVEMYSPYLALPFYIDSVVVEGRVEQLSGPKAELTTAYPVRGKGWWVWVRLPDAKGEFVFAKIKEHIGSSLPGPYSYAYGKNVLVRGPDEILVRVSEEREKPFLWRISIVSGKSGSERVTKVIQRYIEIPLNVPIRQVSGPSVELCVLGGKPYARIPNQVCTLIFEEKNGNGIVVVRVWEDRDKRYFVSAKKGDDNNPGTEDEPFRTLQHAVNFILKNDPERNADIYVAGGLYDQGYKTFTLSYRISVYGGFDENGWRRDPIITRSVLLPHGFRENWVDDISDRYKDLRRAESRYHETILLRRFEKRSYQRTIDIGTRGSPRLEVCGTPDTYFDGVTVYGPDETGVGESTIAFISLINSRTIRNCIFILFWSAGHVYVVSHPGGMQARFENNIVQGGIVGHYGHARPQIVGSFGHWHRNLIIGSTGGDYSRLSEPLGRSWTLHRKQLRLEWFAGTSLRYEGSAYSYLPQEPPLHGLALQTLFRLGTDYGEQ